MLERTTPVHRYSPPGDLPGRVFAPTGRLLWRARVTATPEHAFLVGQQRTWTFAEADTEMRRVAAALSRLGVGPGTRVGVAMANDEVTLWVHAALRELRAVVVLLVPGLTAPELRFQLEHSEAEVLVLGEPMVEVAEAVVPDLPHLRKVSRADLDELGASTEAPWTGPDDEDDPMAPWAIFYTSGSTGRPKGVVLPAGAFSSAGSGYADRFEVREDDTYLLPTPMAHAVGGLTAQSRALYTGCRLAIVDRFSPSRFWDQVRDRGATVSILFPAHLNLLLETQQGAPTRGAHPLRLVITHAWHEPFRERFGSELALCWGMTETGAASAGTRPGERPEHPGLVGRGMHDVRLAIVNEEIRLYHPHHMLEYLKDPAATAATLTDDGWIRSGDTGELDDQGRLFYGGRIKNMIKRSGENISPEEIENALVEHPAVHEALVVGVADPIRTEEVAAVVVLAGPAAVEAADLSDYLAERLARFKLPRYLALRREALPRLAAGKVDRSAALDQLNLGSCWDRLAVRE